MAIGYWPRFGATPFARGAERLSNDIRDLRHLIDAHEGVHFRKKFRQFLAEPLRETAGNDQALPAILRLAQFGRFQDGVDALLLRGVDERAGIDDHHVGLGGVVGDFHAALRSEPSMISASTRFLAQPREIKPTRTGRLSESVIKERTNYAMQRWQATAESGAPARSPGFSRQIDRGHFA